MSDSFYRKKCFPMIIKKNKYLNMKIEAIIYSRKQDNKIISIHLLVMAIRGDLVQKTRCRQS